MLVVDDFRVGPITDPVYTISGPMYPHTSASATAGASNVFTANHIQGDLTGMTLAWTSQNGTLTPNGATATVTYTNPGPDVITLTATNSYGSYTTTFDVTAISCGAITSFPYTQDFEADDANCWVSVDGNGTNDDDFMIGHNSSNAHGGEGYAVSYYNETAANNDYLISPAIVMPANATGMTLKWWVRGGAYQSANGRYEVLVSTTGTALTDFSTVLYNEVITSSDNVVQNYEQRNAELGNYAGQTIYLAFHNITDADANNLFIDDIEIVSTLIPVYTLSAESSVQTGLPLTLTATYVEGVQQGMVVTWSSQMAANNQATIANANSENATITYNAPGTDQITFTATNSYGTFTDVLTVNVFSCDPITDLPWMEGLEGATDCWSLATVDNASDGFVIFEAYTNQQGQPVNYANSGTHCLFGTYSDDVDVDQWAISPAVILPADAEGYKLSFYVMTTAYQGIMSHYQVLLSTTGAASSDFTEVLFEETDSAKVYVQREVDLSAYAGETIRIAFRNMTARGGDAMMIDDIEISNTVGIRDVASATAISVSPNPATSMVEVKAEGIEGRATASILDLSGRTLMQQQAEADTFRFDVSTLPAGAYFVRLVGQNVNSVQKLIVK
ncbi:MAG: choice-of-anchor J domain-containing protein [Bacteroidales bacterium]|nr:choice-of-anchor J domain-containing protein [Bacteroidales bacterium]